MIALVADWRGDYEEIRLAEDTIDLEIPAGVSFLPYGAMPTHIDHITTDQGRTYRQFAVFVPRDQCRWCRVR